ncbi:hypothetical protein GGF46_002798 [Coemansia sp. RSA 552]|nr:hypothetical protein GGF46_002864 [Coemansia sp. RSA 552]KAJ2159759.1 hypothetical protein GGF46_002798 [Coemansia sp. RSA 552]
MAMAFTWSFLYVIQHIQWDEQCPTETQADQQFVFDNHRPLHIDCRDHTSLSNIRIVPATNQTTVHVRVEASSWWRNRINIDHNQGSSGNSLKVKVRQTPWGWLRGCVRATVVVALPETLALQVDSDSGTVLVRNVDMKALRVATAHGRISIIDVHTQDSLDLNGHNTMIELTRVSAPRISATTVNAGIRATNVTGSEVTLHTANAGLVLRRVHTDVLRAQSSNGAIHGDARVQREVDLVTSNGALQMDIQGSTTTEFIAAHSSNGPVGLGLLSVAGIFSVQASGSTADIIADKEKLRLDKDSTSAKTGAFAQGSTRISVSTSNSQAILRLS